MSVELVFRFPLGRYHATPWGSNVNEGAVEWPPSPWRLLRALYATWRNRVPTLDADVVHGLLDQLAEPPLYLLPPHRAAHTRHYYPGTDHKAGVKTSTTKVIDGFVSVSPDDRLIVRWAVDLPDNQLKALRALADELTYLGRAESVCEAAVSLDTPVADGGRVCAPLPVDSGAADGLDLLVPDRPLDIGALTITTTTMRNTLRRRQPPGSHRVRYPAPAEAPHRHAPRYPTVPKPTAIRWSIASPARPARTAALAWTDVLRGTALRIYAKLYERPAPDSLSGLFDDPSRGREHRHVHWLAFGDDRLLSTLVAWSPAGFDDDVLDALATIRRLSRPGISDVRPSALGLEGWGDVKSIAPELTRASTTWESFTPFVPTRHPHGVPLDEHVRSSVFQDLAWRTFQAPTSVDVLDPKDRGHNPPWAAYRTHRPTGERLGNARRAVGVRLHFPVRVQGPITLGALSHFGLGLFGPVDQDG